MKRAIIIAGAIAAVGTLTGCPAPQSKPVACGANVSIVEGQAVPCIATAATSINVRMVLGDDSDAQAAAAIERCNHLGGQPVDHPKGSFDPYHRAVLCNDVDH